MPATRTSFDWLGIQAAAAAANWTNLVLTPDPPPITGDDETDRLWRQIATGRGYQRRPLVADVDQLKTISQSRHRLQPQAAVDFETMQQAARAAGHPLTLSSAYRDHDYQAKLFLRLLDQPYREEEIDRRLRRSALPGYSKHHTGYVVDLAEGDYILEQFVESGSYQWLADDGFANARRWGWIPSYPAGGTPQGPEPEPWELIWVGDVDQLQAKIDLSGHVPGSKAG